MERGVTIKKVKIETPMHFTKEQSDWIKKYVILKRYATLDEFREKITSYLAESSDFADFVVTDNNIDTVIREMKGDI